MNTLKTSRLFIALLLLGPAIAANAQATSGEAAKQAPAQVPQTFLEPTFYIWLLVAFILLIVIIALSQAVNSLSLTLQEKSGMVAPGATAREYASRETAWGKLMRSLTRSVPVEKEEDVLLHHNYDGIQELDNQLPPWWKYGFYVTIVFAFVYLVHYHVSGTGPSQLAEYNEAMKTAEMEKEARMKASADYVTEASVVALKEEAAIAAGHDIYVKNCLACHGDKGQGTVGPNLTDDFWIHGGGIKNIFRTVTEGVSAKGMISWKSQLSPKQIQEVSSFILTLHGTNPEGAKEPQGDKWVEEGAAAPADSTGATADSAAVAVATGN